MYLTRRIENLIKNGRCYSSEENPYKRTWEALTSDFSKMVHKLKPGDGSETFEEQKQKLPVHADVVVIGGGLLGSSIAYWMQERARDAINVLVLDTDHKRTRTSIVNSVQGLKQQYSLPENIQLSMAAADFLRESRDHLGSDIDINYFPQGNLVLAHEDVAETIEENLKIQKGLGLKVVKLTKGKINEKYPWINTEDIEFGCFSLENEGWFDSSTLLWGLKRKAIQRGASFFDAELVDFKFKIEQNAFMEGVRPGSYRPIDKLVVRNEGILKEMDFCICVIAAGIHSKSIADLAGIGKGDGILSIPFPMETRKQTAFYFECTNNNVPEMSTPLVHDGSGLWFKRYGFSNMFVAGLPYPKNMSDDLFNETDYFYNEVLPLLAQRVPAFRDVKLGKSITELFEYNSFDENGIIGYHPYHQNLLLVSGFNAQGTHVLPAVGKAVSDIIINGDFLATDLTRLCFDRLITNTPQYESNLI